MDSGINFIGVGSKITAADSIKEDTGDSLIGKSDVTECMGACIGALPATIYT